MPKDPLGYDRSNSTTSQAGQVMGVGLQFAGSIVLFLLLGRWLDGRLGTSPWLLIAGVVIGATGGFYSMYRQLVLRPQARDRDGKEGGA